MIKGIKKLLVYCVCLLFIFTGLNVQPITRAKAESVSDYKTYTYAATGHKYALIENKSLSWNDAKNYCESLGGYLATITSQDEQNYINSILTNGTDAYYWIGGLQQPNSSEPSGGWTWVSGETSGYRNWLPWQPDNYRGDNIIYLSGCRGISSGDALGKWGDDISSGCVALLNFGFICEWGNDQQVNDADQMKTYTNSSTGHKYALIENKSLSWNDAKAYCESLGGYLATITSQDEQYYINSILSYGTEAYYWIGGLQQPNSSEPSGGWTWVTGETSGYRNWLPWQPDNYRGDNIIYLSGCRGISSGDALGKWGDDISSGCVALLNFGFICEWGNDQQVNDADQMKTYTNSSTGHKYALIENKSLSWNDAKAYCESLGGYLATITSQDEQYYINSILSYGTEAYYWIGGLQQPNSSEPSGGWTWVTGETSGYRNWLPCQPDNYHGDNIIYISGCRGISSGDALGGWGDDISSGFVALPNFGFICEWGGDLSVIPDNIIKNAGENAAGYQIYTSKITGYKYAIIDKYMKWYDAEAYCESLGGHLATVKSQNDQECINSILSFGGKSYYWIGGYQPTGSSEPAGGWEWNTGEDITYTNWQNGQPDNYRNDNVIFAIKDYLGSSTNGKWVDETNEGIQDNGKYGFVCEWDGRNPASNFYYNSSDNANDNIKMSVNFKYQQLKDAGVSNLNIQWDTAYYDYDGIWLTRRADNAAGSYQVTFAKIDYIKNGVNRHENFATWPGWSKGNTLEADNGRISNGYAGGDVVARAMGYSDTNSSCFLPKPYDGFSIYSIIPEISSIKLGSSGYITYDKNVLNTIVDKNMRITKIGDEIADKEPGWTNYDDNDPNISYDNMTYTQNGDTANYLNGGVHTTNMNSDCVDRVKFNFVGTQFRLAVNTGSDINQNIVVYIDNKYVETFSAPQETKNGHIIYYISPSVASGEHTVELLKDIHTNSGYMAIDIIQVLNNGSIKEFTGITHDINGSVIKNIGENISENEPCWTTYDDDDSNISYDNLNDWHNGDTSDFLNGGAHTSYGNSNCMTRAKFDFTGNQFRLAIQYHSDNRNQNLNVYIDNKLAQNISAGQNTTWGHTLYYISPVLTNGPHTVEINKSVELNTDGYMLFDMVQIYGTGKLSPFTGTPQAETQEDKIILTKIHLEKVINSSTQSNADLKNANRIYDAVIDDNYNKALDIFFKLFDEKYDSQRAVWLESEYDSLPERYKIISANHWTKLYLPGCTLDQFLDNLLPDEYYDYTPAPPQYDSDLGEINSENKQESQIVYDYYSAYIYPLGAIFHAQWDKSKLNRENDIQFSIWSAEWYGLSQKQKDDAFKTGIIVGLCVQCPMETAEGIVSSFKHPVQTLKSTAFLIKATVFGDCFPKEQQELINMIDTAVKEWDKEYTDGDSLEKGEKIGELIGQVIILIDSTAGTIEDFVDSGRFATAFEEVAQTATNAFTIGDKNVLVMGLETVSNGDGYIQYAERYGLSTYEYFLVGDESDINNMLLTAIEKSKQIVFKLDDFNIQEALDTEKYTNFEFNKILNNSDYLNKTVFIEDNTIVPKSKVIEEATKAGIIK